MTRSYTCNECNREFSIEYEETDSTPVFCPFCAEELPEWEFEVIVPNDLDNSEDDSFDNF